MTDSLCASRNDSFPSSPICLGAGPGAQTWAGEQLVDPLGSSLVWDQGTGFRFKVQLWTRSCAEGQVKE